MRCIRSGPGAHEPGPQFMRIALHERGAGNRPARRSSHELLTLVLVCLLFLCPRLAAAQVSAPAPSNSLRPATVFSDDFESGLTRWKVTDTAHVRAVDSHSTTHAKVLELTPNGALVHALVRGSHQWPRVSVEGEMLFPDEGQSYLGFIWGYRLHEGRSSYGNIYVKGNDSYVQVNPHWDDNPVREMYPEYSASLEGKARLRVGEWKRFRVELFDGTVHIYVGDTSGPQLTFALLASDAEGEIGFRPRVVGARVWIDNIRVRVIDRLSAADARPAAESSRDRLLTAWEINGPFDRADKVLEMGREHGERTPAWRAFPTDARGAVVAARVLDYLGARTVAYFRTRLRTDTAKVATLRLATLNHAAIWLNGQFLGHASPVETAWYDIASDSTRPQLTVRLRLQPGDNILLLRLRGGQYATGGFYAAMHP